MKTFLHTMFFFFLVTQICLAQLDLSSSESKSEYPSIKLSKYSFNIDSLITTTMNTYHIPGLSACLVRDGEIIWKGAYGYADIEHNKYVTDSTLFTLASVSKPFTGTALMQLWENGLFDLDEDINNHLPFSVRNPYHPNDPITFRMLLTHTSSISDNWTILVPLFTGGGDSPIPLDSFLTNYLVPGGVYYSNANYINATPSAFWSYSNVGTTLIGFLVETISNMPFAQYCQDSIFIPLGMNETAWFLRDLDTNTIALPYYYSGGTYFPYGHYGYVFYPASGLKSSAVQLARFLIAFMQNGQINGIRILDSTTVDLMTTVQVHTPNYEQALIWKIYPYTIPGFGTYTFCGHDGVSKGVRTGMDYTLETDKHVSVIVLSNGESQDGLFIIWDALYAYSTLISSSVDGDFTSPPQHFYLSQNFPNPFNPSTKINYSVPLSSQVQVNVFDVLGNKIETLVNEEKPAGTYELIWNASTLPSGVYFYRIQAGDFIETKKMILMK